MSVTADREAIADLSNPLGLQGIEFVEYATARPQALGQALELMGFRPVARHRSREVLLYRQGGMNVIVNAHVGARPAAGAPGDAPWIPLSFPTTTPRSIPTGRVAGCRSAAGVPFPIR